jgi:hypothetical protein
MCDPLESLCFATAAREMPLRFAFDTHGDRMMDDRKYFEQRAAAELRRAQTSSVPEAVRVHYELAGHYLDRAHGDRDPREGLPRA